MDISGYTNEKGYSTKKLSNEVSVSYTNSRKYEVINSKYRLYNMNGEYWFMALDDLGKALYIITLESKRIYNGLTLEEVKELSAKGDALTIHDFYKYVPSKSIPAVGDISYAFSIDEHWEIRINNNGFEISLDDPIPEGVEISLIYNPVASDIYGMRITHGNTEKANIRNLPELTALITKYSNSGT